MNGFMLDLFKKAYEKRIPISATLQITGQCNFRCIHCYIDEQERQQFLSYEQAKSFIDAVRANGCLYLTITGGEPLLHPEFANIYMYAYLKGLLLSVYTNGSLLTDKWIQFFVEHPPRRVEITMYGYSDEISNEVTRSQASTRVKSSIYSLVSHNVVTMIKAFAMKENNAEIDEIRKFANNMGTLFKAEGLIIAPQGSSQMSHQLPLLDAIKYEGTRTLSDSFNDETVPYGDYTRTISQGKLFRCGAGRTACWLKPNNHMCLCYFVNDFEYDMSTYSFEQVWSEYGVIINQELSDSSPCQKCELREHCDSCPITSCVLTGDFYLNNPPREFCERARYRKHEYENKTHIYGV